MRSVKPTAFVLLFLAGLTTSTQACVYYRESISESSTRRIVHVPGWHGGKVSEERTEGNTEFGAPANSLTYVHSILGITPPLLPDGRIRCARLKLYLHHARKDHDCDGRDHWCNRDDDDDQDDDDNDDPDRPDNCRHWDSEITVTVDAIQVDHFKRRIHLIDSRGHDYVRVEDSPLGDGILEVSLSSPDREFVLYRSVLDVWYIPSLPTGVMAEEEALPAEFALAANYPNPFNPTTTIAYSLPAPGPVHLQVVDILGRSVRTLVDDVQSSGSQVVEWDGKDESGAPVPSGIYFSVLQAGSAVASRKLVLLK